MEEDQLNAGTVHGSKSGDGTSLWHTGVREGKKGYWCGNWHYRTPLELLRECESTIADLLVNHPELKESGDQPKTCPWCLVPDVDSDHIRGCSNYKPAGEAKLPS